MGTSIVKVLTPMRQLAVLAGNPAGSWPMLLHVEQVASGR